MTLYSLIARLGDRKREYAFTAANDTEATFDSIAIILRKAMENEIWAVGSIELRNLDAETIVQSMAAKEDALP
jgi:TnpA family transposase